jgi:hypothetical protein
MPLRSAGQPNRQRSREPRSKIRLLRFATSSQACFLAFPRPSADETDSRKARRFLVAFLDLVLGTSSIPRIALFVSSRVRCSFQTFPNVVPNRGLPDLLRYKGPSARSGWTVPYNSLNLRRRGSHNMIFLWNRAVQAPPF